MREESKRGVTVLNGKFFKDGLSINPFKKSVDGKTLSRLIVYGTVGLILVRLGFWNSSPIDTFYFAFAFGLYLDVRVELRELRKEIRGKK